MLFLSGCVSNQAKFYPRFDAIVLLSAPADVILERAATRITNNFGKTEAERNRILNDLATVEPLLRVEATAEIDSRAPLDDVVDALERIASKVGLRAQDDLNAEAERQRNVLVPKVRPSEVTES